MNFGVISLPQLNKHSLDTLNFPRGILVFLLGLVFFLGSTEQYEAIKIGITFFGSKLDLLCISKVLTIFCVFSKIRWERKHSRGHVACSPSARGDSSVWALGRAAHSESTREGFSQLGHAGHVAGSGASRVAPGESVLGTRVLLGGLPDVAYGLGTRGQVACSEASGGSLPA